jgi:hypothetical protein
LAINGKSLAKVEKTPHIGIQRDSKNSTVATIKENLKNPEEHFTA